MRTAAKVDDNQGKIVEYLEAWGCTVFKMQAMGHGFPDLLVWRNGTFTLLEVKDGSKPPSARKLTDDQEKWHAKYGLLAHIVCSEEQAWEAVKRSAR